MTGRLRVWGPAWVMMALIFVMSSIPELPAGAAGIDDGVAHALEYGVLAALLLRGFAGTRRAGVSGRAAVFAVLVATGYGISDEVHQRFVPGRIADLADLAADAAGASASVALIWAWRRVTLPAGGWSIVTRGDRDER